MLNNKVELTDSPIIVTGTQRSGTTLLHHVLNCSGQIWSRNEMYEVHDLMFDPRYRNENGADELIRRLEGFLKLSLSSHGSFDSSTARCNLLDFAMSQAAQNEGKRRWCLKDPRATYYMNEYAAAFPEMRFVIIVRDPRAVCRSYLDTKTFAIGRPANVISAAERWTDEVQKQIEFIETYPERTWLVHYEKLVGCFSSEITRVGDFLSIQVTQEMVSYHREPPKIKIHEGNRNVLRPPDTRRVDAWKDALTAKQIGIVESVSKDLMVNLGYDPITPPRTVTYFSRALARVHDRAINEVRWQMQKWR